ncbi:WSSV512 [White spot syndrome virus]|uniref:WSSV512 n=1 Tax=White spot syndrome virus TaxID=342409 RepID=A0A2I6SCH2_9VIRU|nr:WSSV512 [White spot syndrome virus]AYV99257.1 wssv092 [White spot syndrome virus]WOG35265.1 hypothetical protein SWSSV_gp084 [White spot syndrome virus]
MTNQFIDVSEIPRNTWCKKHDSPKASQISGGGREPERI